MCGSRRAVSFRLQKICHQRDDLCGAVCNRFGPGQFGLAPDRARGAKLPVVPAQQGEISILAIHKTGQCNVGVREHSIFARHGFSAYQNPGSGQAVQGKVREQAGSTKEKGKGQGQNLGFKCRNELKTPARDEQAAPSAAAMSAGRPQMSRKRLSECKVPSTIQCVQLSKAILQMAGKTHSGLGEFLRRSLQTSRSVCSSSEIADLWLCPPPMRRWTADSKPSPRKRRRRRFLEARAKVLQVVVCALNWLTLGYPKSPPPAARLGSYIH